MSNSLALLLAAAAALPSPAGHLPATRDFTVDLGLTAPVTRLGDVATFSRHLAKLLVWTVDGETRRGLAPAIRFTAVRVERGRVTASYQSDAAAPPNGLSHVIETIGASSFASFPDVCLDAEDPPADLKVLSGKTALDPAELEKAIATLARSRRLGDSFRLARPFDVDWGRHVVLILAAASDGEPVLVRPLILVLERV